MKVGTMVKAKAGILIKPTGTIGIIIKVWDKMGSTDMNASRVQWNDGEKHWINQHWVNNEFLTELKCK